MRENHQGRRRLLLHRRLSSKDDGGKERERERERSADFHPPLTFLISSFHPPPRQTSSSSSFTSLLFQPYQSILGLSYAASSLFRGAAPTHIATTPTTRPTIYWNNLVMGFVFVLCVRSKSFLPIPSCIFFLEWNLFGIHFIKQKKQSMVYPPRPMLGPISRTMIRKWNFQKNRR